MSGPNDKQLLTMPNAGPASLSVRASALVFADPATRRVLDLIERIAPSDATVLVIGETGTGKELIARHLHNLSARSGGPFCAVNCGAFAETLVESELFGHEAGAYTGAKGESAGWFETANGGTLFLDEIGDLPAPVQVKLLRVLQEREVVRVGGRKSRRVDVRLVAATNVDLEAAVAAGRFRADLYYRIKVLTVNLPALRDRPGDILPLAEHFLDRYGRRLQVERPLASDAQRALLAYPWPGNIRELENVIHRAVLVANGDGIHAEDLLLPLPLIQAVPAAPAAQAASPEQDAADRLKAAIRALLEEEGGDLLDRITAVATREAYAHGGGSQVQAAKALGISRNVFRSLMKRHGLLKGDGRSGRVVAEERRSLLSW